MTRYLLDTTELIDFARGHEPAASWIRTRVERADELGVCGINVAEFYSGLPRGSQPLVDDFIDALAYWDLTRASAARAGADRYSYARSGVQLSTADVVIAAVAREKQAMLVTGNTKDFPMSDIQVLDLRGRA